MADEQASPTQYDVIREEVLAECDRLLDALVEKHGVLRHEPLVQDYYRKRDRLNRLFGR